MDSREVIEFHIGLNIHAGALVRGLWSALLLFAGCVNVRNTDAYRSTDTRLRHITVADMSLTNVAFDVAVERIVAEIRRKDASAPRFLYDMPGWHVPLGDCPPDLRRAMALYVVDFEERFVRRWITLRPINLDIRGATAWDALKAIATFEDLELMVDGNTVRFVYCHAPSDYICHAYVMPPEQIAALIKEYGSLTKALSGGRGTHDLGLFVVEGTGVFFFVETPSGHDIFETDLRTDWGYRYGGSSEIPYPQTTNEL